MNTKIMKIQTHKVTFLFKDPIFRRYLLFIKSDIIKILYEF